MTHYAAGWNMASYSPEPDNIWITDSFESAVQYLVSEVEHWWDGDYMGQSEDESADDIDGRYLTAHADLHNAGTIGPEFSTVVYDPNGYPYTFWITETEEEMDDE